MNGIKIVKDDNFDELKERHNKNMEISEDYRSAIDSIASPKGRKLLLDISVEDEYLSSNVMGLLHGKIEGQELLGFSVNSVVINPKGYLDDLINQTEQQLEILKQVRDNTTNNRF
jgi:hypothetical protein